MKPFGIAFIVAAACHAAIAHADAPLAVEPRSIYEAIDDVAIGRVFLSPAERKRLDAVRHLPERAATTTAGTAVTPETKRPEPTGLGFIRAHGKAPRVFRDGDFVTAQPGDRDITAVPAGIIVRHENAARDDEP